MMIQFCEIISKQCKSSQEKHFEIVGGFDLIKFDVDASASIHFVSSILFQSRHFLPFASSNVWQRWTISHGV